MDFSIFPVVSGGEGHLTCAHTADPLRHAGPGGMCDLLERRIAQDVEFRAEAVQKRIVTSLHFCARGRKANGGGDHLRQRDDALKGARLRGAVALFAIRQVFYAVQHADGQLFPAERTAAVRSQRFRWLQAQLAVAVSVKMIFTLLRKKFNRARKACGMRRFYSLCHFSIGKGRVEKIRLSAELLRGMCVRIGDERVIVERGEPPVHRRVGGEAGFHRMNIGRHIPKARFHRIEAGKRAEHGKMRRPDMRGDEDRLRADIHRDLQQVTAV